MKIVDRETFLSLPSGTLFSKCEPWIFDHLTIKGPTCGNDFMEQQIVDAVNANDTGEHIDLLEDSLETRSSIPLDFHSMGRDGCFDRDQLFAVWERQDVRDLIDRLSEALEEQASA